LRPADDRLFSWILGLGPTARYNLTSSGLSEPLLASMGVETSFEKFASAKDEHERLFAEEVASLYRVEPHNVVATNGGSEAIFLVYSVLGEGATAVVPLPNYNPMFEVPRALGMQVTSRLSAPPAPRRVVVGLTDPNNPKGQSLDPAVVEDLSASAGKDGTVFINETYGEFTFRNPPLTHFGTADNLVTCSTVTKFFGLGRLRVGWILSDRKTAGRLLYAKWAVSGHDSAYSLWIATQVLRKRRRFAERAKKIHSRNVKIVREFIAETNGVSTELGVAPFCLVRYGRGPGSVALAKSILKKTGVLVSPGDFFGARKAFRLCFTAEGDTLRSGLDELSRFLNRL
jgi:aspartate/methionine/tyrosine aminotransferase